MRRKWAVSWVWAGLITVLAASACADPTADVDVVAYADLIREQIQRMEDRAFEDSFILEGRFTEPTDAQRSVDVDDHRFYRTWTPSLDERQALEASGYRFCPLTRSMDCPEWNREPEAALIAMGIPERLSTLNYRLPYTWAVRLGGGFSHSGAGYMDVRRGDANSQRWTLLRNQQLWMDH